MTDPAIIEAAARALYEANGRRPFYAEVETLARAVLTAVTPLIEAATLGEAAQMIENYTKGGADIRMIIGDIRARKEQP